MESSGAVEQDVALPGMDRQARIGKIRLEREWTVSGRKEVAGQGRRDTVLTGWDWNVTVRHGTAWFGLALPAQLNR